MKRFFTILFTAILIISGLSAGLKPASAASKASLGLQVNGKLTDFQYGKPFIESGRSLVPLRDLLVAIGVTNDDKHIIWNGAEESVTAVLDQNTVKLAVGDKEIYLNGKVFSQLEVPAKNMSGRVFLPARAVAEAFGYYVDFDASTQTILVQSTPFENNKETAIDDNGLLSELNYHGKQDVTSTVFVPDTTIKGMHHYTLELQSGPPIDIYVSQSYEDTYGKGFAYEEIGPMILSIAKVRNMEPYKLPDQRLRMFFYNGEASLQLPLDYQAAAGWQNNARGSIDIEVVVNGAIMPYDFRTSVQHELYHYFDFHYLGGTRETTFRQYWGSEWQFWLMEGGAEYSSYTYYNYPANKHNKLDLNVVEGTKNALIRYAMEQGGYRKNLLYQSEYKSFGELYKAASNNYGITHSLFWYLADTFGTDKIYSYIDQVARDYSKVSGEITQDKKDATARSVFGKTEQQILTDWLAYFNTFGGSLIERKELKNATVTQVFWPSDPLMTDWLKENVPTSLPGKPFLVNVKEYFTDMDYTQADTFKEHATSYFRLEAEGEQSVQAVMNGYNFSGGQLSDGSLMNLFLLLIPTEEYAKMKKGVNYRIVPVDQDPVYTWNFPSDITINLP